MITTSPLSHPDDYHCSAIDLFYNTVRETDYAPYLDIVLQLLNMAKDGSSSTKISLLLEKIPANEFDDFIHVLHITLFVQNSDTKAPLFPDLTPVTGAIQNLLTTMPLNDALALLPGTITDVLTAHPVDMDRGLILSHKQDYEKLSREWERSKRLYKETKKNSDKMILRSTLNTLSSTLKNTIRLLLYTPNYRHNRIQPESEQRHLSRAIKDHEMDILSHWNKLITVVQVLCLQQLLNDEIEKTSSLSTYSSYIELPPTKDTLRKLSAINELRTHTLFKHILDLSQTLKYKLETWRGDMDGNPYVTATTMALSMAYGRKRSFERLSADDAVIRYTRDDLAPIEAELDQTLNRITETGETDWKTYISERRSSSWTPIQIYSGLAYYRMVELTEAAELFSRNPDSISLLKTGFKTSHEFLEFTEPLAKIESIIGIENGVWHTQRQLVDIRGLSLGHPHIRKGEEFNVALVDAIHSQSNTSHVSLTSLSEREQCAQLDRDLSSAQTLTSIPDTLSKESKDLLDNYLDMMAVDDHATLIQSDSADTLASINASILLMKLVSTYIGHKGKIVILCENERSMTSAIELMQDKTKRSLFDNVIMMCAGSDNQKKLGPFYSAYLNYTFLDIAYKNNIESFFGVGDSPLRSSPHEPLCHLKTLQPGSRKHHFFGERIHGYLSNRLANRISAIRAKSNKQPSNSDKNKLIFKILGREMMTVYKDAVRENTALHSAIKDISEIATTYFSRPTKKTSSNAFILDQIRAIDSGRAQLILNTFDPQLAGLKEGLDRFFTALKETTISKEDCHQFFNTTDEGQGLLNTLAYFASILDDTLDTPSAIRTVTETDIKTAYYELSGQHLNIESDHTLRLVRQIWMHVENTPELHTHKANTLLLFGANWMI